MLPFASPLTHAEASAVRDAFGTPCYVYDEDRIAAVADFLRHTFSIVPGFVLRYAMKANSCIGVMRTLLAKGVHIDASSLLEVNRALGYGFDPRSIQPTSQCPISDEALLEFVFRQGVSYNACSVTQLGNFCRVAAQLPGVHHVTVRVNPGIGSGSTARCNVGGPASSFGVWNGALDDIFRTIRGSNVRITGLHSHIGSGTDPDVWERAADLTLALIDRFPDVTTVSLGGGFKVDRMKPPTNLLAASTGDSGVNELAGAAERIRQRFERYSTSTGRTLKLELEPGTYFVATAGVVVATVIDLADTSRSVDVSMPAQAQGFFFAKLDAGMNQVLRPSLYGAQHPIWLFPSTTTSAPATSAAAPAVTDDADGRPCPVVFVGPCCESGDILTPLPADPEGLAPRLVARRPLVGDIVVIGGCGAYCSSMATTNYNSYPAAPEVMIRHGSRETCSETRQLQLVRRRQTLAQVLENEVAQLATP